MKSEKQIQNEIRVALSLNDCVCFRGNVGLFYTKTGMPVSTGLPKGFSDLFGYRIADGKMFFVEVKNETGRIRPEQKIFIEAMIKNGVLAGVARSAEDALKIVEVGGYEHAEKET